MIQKLKSFQYIKSSLTTIFNFVTDKKDQLDLETFSDDLPTFEDIQKRENNSERGNI